MEFIHIFHLQTASAFCSIDAWQRKTKQRFLSVGAAETKPPNADLNTSRKSNPCAKNARAEGRQRNDRHVDGDNSPAAAICTNSSCNRGGQEKYFDLPANLGPTFWTVDVTPDDEAFFGLDTIAIPAFCPHCLSGVIRTCLRCGRPIRVSEIRNLGCIQCGERYRSGNVKE